MDAAGDHGPILVVDDDAALAEMLQLVLIKEGFSTAWVGHGSDVMDVFREHRPALVLLDLMLPGRDGIRICQDIRRESGVPIIMLTARTDTPNVVQGLGAGADDYVCKPFRSAELIARIRARLRTPVSRREEGEVITVGDLTIDPVAHLVQLGGEEISLTPLEYSLLVTMAQYPWGGKLITLAGRAGRGWRPGWCPSWLTGPRRLWWSSLPLRTVTVTLSSSLVILIVGGFFLVRQATAGIVEAKRTSAVAETTATINRIQGQLRDTDLRTASFYERLNLLADDAASQSDQYHVLIQGPVSGLISQGVSPDSVPTDLTATVGESNGMWTAPTTVHYTDHVRPDVPGIVVGSTLWSPEASQSIPVYFIFPETQEVAAVELLRRSVISVGALMALAIAVTTYLATRHISLPIRQASITASKLAKGALDERMVVRGTDDLATLASSMNDMAAQLDLRIGELEKLSSLQQQFVSDVSHELRTPMTTMRMASEMVEANPDDPVQVRSVELMRAQMERLELLLADLLEISRFDAGAAQLSLEDCDIVDLVRSEISDVTPLADRLGVSIVLVAEAAQTAEVDPRRISRIVRNLVSNAVEHAEGKTVEVTVVGNDCAVGVAVRDHGVGFEAWQAEKVFGRFWRGDPSRVRTVGGSGLGLAISRQDANLHHGWLTAWGRPNQGAYFRLVVPRQPGGVIVKSPLPASPTDADRSDDEEER